MLDKIKQFLLQSVVLVINVALVLGGVLFIRHQQQKKQDQQDADFNAAVNKAQQGIETQAQQLQQIVDQNRNQKNETIANNPATVTVQKPVTVTQVIPAKTTTIKVPVTSSTTKTS